MRTSKFSPRIRGELEGGKIKPVSFSTKASGIVKCLEKPNKPNECNDLGMAVRQDSLRLITTQIVKSKLEAAALSIYILLALHWGVLHNEN